MNEKTMTLKEAGERLNVHPRTVAHGVRRGELRGIFGGLHQNRIVGVYAADVEALRPNGTPDGDGYQTRDIHPAKK